MGKRQLVMACGAAFIGDGFGHERDALCELVFNTSMAGYQEVVTDPSYTAQAVVMTYPVIGNYGVTDEDSESRAVTMGALVTRAYCDRPSNFRYVKTLSELLEENGVPGLCGVDTRQIARKIRDTGAQKALLCGADVPLDEALARINAYTLPTDSVSRVSCKKKWYARTAGHAYHVALVDCGVKLNIVRKLCEHGCNVTVVPYDATAEDILSLKPDGVLVSNGPGDPQDVPEVIALIRALRGRLPIFGICLGHQLLSLACGAQTYKLKFGHRGGNHPVMELSSGKIAMTSQNHGYAVDGKTLAGTGLTLARKNLLDGTCEGVIGEQLLGVQYHPESAPGPQDSEQLFDSFCDMMKEARAHA